MQLTDYLALIRERIILVVLVVAATAVAAAMLFTLRAPAYEASVRVRARPPAPFSPSNEVLQQEQTDLGTEAELVRSTTVAQEVIERLGLQVKPDDLLNQISTGVTPNTAVLVILANADQPELAVNLANTFADAYLEFRREALTDTVESQVERIESELAGDLRRLSELDRLVAELEPGSTGAVAATLEREQVLAEIVSSRQSLAILTDRRAVQEGFGEVIQPAVDARSVRSTSLPRALVFGVLIGVPLALAVVLLLDSLNRTIRSQSDAERATGAELLGVIPIDPQWSDPRDPRLATRASPLSPIAEAYRTLAHNLARVASSTSASSLVFTSPGDGDGKTSVVANTAVALSETGRRTTLVEADLRNPRLHAFLDLPEAPGLGETTSGDVAVADVVQHVGPALDFIAAGRPVDRPDALVARIWNEDLVSSLVAGTDRARPLRASRSAGTSSIGTALVLVDSPPLLSAAESSTLVAGTDAAVLVLRAGLTSRQDAARAARQIRQAGGVLTGVVLIGGRLTDDSALTTQAPAAMAAPVGAKPPASAAGNA